MSANISYNFGVGGIRSILAVFIFIIVLNLSGFISGLVAMDDNWDVLKDNLGKYAYLIIMSILYLVLGIASVVGLGYTFSPQFPASAFITITGSI